MRPPVDGTIRNRPSWALSRPAHRAAPAWAPRHRSAPSWPSAAGRRLAQAHLRADAAACAQHRPGLLDRGLSPERPVAILSDNDLEHALLGLAACMSACPTRRSRRPIRWSPATSASCATSRPADPGLVFAADGAQFAGRWRPTFPADVEVVVTRGPPPGRRRHFTDWRRRRPRRGRGGTRGSGPTRSPRSCSPRARPASPRA